MIVGHVMKNEWESMTIDELFVLREQMQEILSAKLNTKKVEIEPKLQRLPSGVEATKPPAP
jgi:hypothetical protein